MRKIRLLSVSAGSIDITTDSVDQGVVTCYLGDFRASLLITWKLPESFTHMFKLRLLKSVIKSDTKGIVILMIDDQITPAIAKQLLQGSADPLNSAFHLTYNMVLNLLRVEDINPEWLLSKSFYQFQHCNKVPGMITRLKELQVEKVIIFKEN